MVEDPINCWCSASCAYRISHQSLLEHIHSSETTSKSCPLLTSSKSSVTVTSGFQLLGRLASSVWDFRTRSHFSSRLGTPADRSTIFAYRKSNLQRLLRDRSLASSTTGIWPYYAAEQLSLIYFEIVAVATIASELTILPQIPTRASISGRSQQPIVASIAGTACKRLVSCPPNYRPPLVIGSLRRIVGHGRILHPSTSALHPVFTGQLLQASCQIAKTRLHPSRG